MFELFYIMQSNLLINNVTFMNFILAGLEIAGFSIKQL